MNPPSAERDAPDLRTSIRYPTKAVPARIGWWDREEFRYVPASLRDISNGGARLDVDLPPSSPEAVWVSVLGGPPTPWIQSRVVGPAASEDGAAGVRVAFAEQCTYEVLRAAVWVTESWQPPPRPSARPETDVRADADSRVGTAAESRPSLDHRRGDQPLTTTAVAGPSELSLVETERAIRASRDRFAMLPHAMTYALGLSAVWGVWYAVTHKIGGAKVIEVLVNLMRR